MNDAEYRIKDFSELEWLQAAMANPVFDFLNDPDEDIYTEQDGKPFEHQQ